MANYLPGVYPAKKKDNTIYYRASITRKSKHISLGSFNTEEEAHEAYLAAAEILEGEATILGYDDSATSLPFAKWVAMVNLRDNGLYCNGPIYLHKQYFDYYLDQHTILRFSADELFYYTHHNIQRRGNHLFVADYGMQVNLLSRYGIKSFAVKNRDYYFKNKDELDFRHGNLVVVNPYVGVIPGTYRGRRVYTSKIHTQTGDIVVGHYETENEAAVAYNKAADMLRAAGCNTAYRENYIEDISDMEYKLIYKRVKISSAVKEYGYK